MQQHDEGQRDGQRHRVEHQNPSTREDQLDQAVDRTAQQNANSEIRRSESPITRLRKKSCAPSIKQLGILSIELST